MSSMYLFFSSSCNWFNKFLIVLICSKISCLTFSFSKENCFVMSLEFSFKFILFDFTKLIAVPINKAITSAVKTNDKPNNKIIGGNPMIKLIINKIKTAGSYDQVNVNI